MKLCKCPFTQKEVEYLGHIISSRGVSTDPKIVKAMQEWSPPKTIEELKGFLGLYEYYRRFIKGYGVVERPLTNLLKKETFK